MNIRETIFLLDLLEIYLFKQKETRIWPAFTSFFAIAKAQTWLQMKFRGLELSLTSFY